MDIRQILKDTTNIAVIGLSKNELNVNSQSYWKNTHKALQKISERLIKLANKVGQLQ